MNNEGKRYTVSIHEKKKAYEGTVWESNNYGSFKIVEYITSKKILISFLATGYRRIVTLHHIKSGEVADKLHRSVYGVGYIGDGLFSSCNKGKTPKSYECWVNMYTRCYSEIYQKEFPTYKGCTVAEEWHNFQNFAKWFEENYIEGYQLDKDIKVEGNKIYGPDTCMFVSNQENSEKANAKYYKMLSPDGIVTEIYNMAQFCEGTDLTATNMIKVYKGRAKTYKGWTKYE